MLEANPSLVGVILIALGVAIIGFAVYGSYTLYQTYTPPSVAATDVKSLVGAAISILLNVTVKLGALGVMVWAGSVLVKHGAGLVAGRG